MSDIDWSQAPEGATHYSPKASHGMRWRRMIAWGWETWDGKEWITTVNAQPHLYIDREDEQPASTPPIITTPTLETMLTEWRDLTARAQAAQAEADALFEHAGQCHGEICVRLAELGWGAPRVAVVASEPANDGWIEYHGGQILAGDDDVVFVRLRDGTESRGAVSTWDWSITPGVPSDNEIVAYRLTPSAQP